MSSGIVSCKTTLRAFPSPLLVTVRVYVIISPSLTDVPVFIELDFTTLKAGAFIIGVVEIEIVLDVISSKSSAVTLAVFVILTFAVVISLTLTVKDISHFSPAAKIPVVEEVSVVTEGFSTYWFVVVSNSTYIVFSGTTS